MKKELKYLLVLNVLSLGLASCNFKSVDKQNHEGARTAEFVTDISDPALNVQSDPNWLKNIYNLMSKKDHASVVKAASEMLRNEATFQKLSSEKAKEGTILLEYYNYSMLERIKANSKGPEIENYYLWAIKGCDKNLKGCESLNFLKNDSKSALVITEIVKLRKDSLAISDYYRLIQIGFEVNNQLRTPELEMLYISRGKEYFDHLEKAGVEEKDNKDRHTRLFQMILGQNTIDKNDPKMVEWLKQLNPWKYSRFDPSYTKLGSIKVFEVAAKNFIYENKKIASGLKQVILENNKASDSNGASFYQSLKLIKDEIAKAKSNENLKILNDVEMEKGRLALIKSQVFKNFKIDIDALMVDSFFTEYFYLVDRLFRNHIGLDEANLFWQGTLKNENEVTKMIDIYTKVELIKMAFRTNIYMGETFKQKDVPNFKLFEQVINRSQPITDEWSMFLAKVNTLITFVKQKADNEKSALMVESEKNLNSISRNVKFLSIYPNMFVIGDSLIDLDAPVTVQSFWGRPIRVEPKTVMKIILSGTVEEPWFIFGGDTAPLNKTETIFAYYYGLELGVFETFSVLKNGTSGTAAKLKFFQTAVRRTLADHTSKVKEATEKLEDMNANKDVTHQNSMVRCEMIEKGNFDFSVSNNADDIKKYLLFGTRRDGTISELYKLYLNGPMSSYRDMDGSEKFRDSFESMLIQIKSMMQIFESRLESEEDKQVLSALKKEMAWYEDLRQRFYAAALEQHKKLGDCLNQFIKLEGDRTITMYELEADYLGTVYDQAKKVREAQGANEKKLALEAAKATLKLGDNDVLTEQRFLFSQWSLVKRVIENSKNLKPVVEFELPDQESQDKYDLKIYTVPFLDLSNGRAFSRDEFISYGLRTIQTHPSENFRWINTILDVEPMLYKLMSIVSIYNLWFDLSKTVSDSEDDRSEKLSKLKKLKSERITAEEILGEGKTILNFLSISEREEKILNYLKLRSRNTKDTLVGVLFDSPDADFKGIIDKVFEEWMSTDKDITEATNFYNERLNLEKFVFPLDKKVVEIVEEKFRTKVSSMDERTTEIFTALNKLASSTKDEDFNIRYELGDGRRGLYSPSLITNGNYRVVSKSVVEEARNTLNNFHKIKTGGCFLKNAKSDCLDKKVKGK